MKKNSKIANGVDEKTSHIKTSSTARRAFFLGLLLL
jgi:hypothetical protein